MNGWISATPMSTFNTKNRPWNSNQGYSRCWGAKTYNIEDNGYTNNYYDLYTEKTITQYGTFLYETSIYTTDLDMGSELNDSAYSRTYSNRYSTFYVSWENMYSNGNYAMVMNHTANPEKESHIDFWSTKHVSHVSFSFSFADVYSVYNRDATRLQFARIKKESDGSTWVCDYQWIDIESDVSVINFGISLPLNTVGFSLSLDKKNSNVSKDCKLELKKFKILTSSTTL